MNEETLKELGYSEKDIAVMSDPEFAHERFSPEEVLFLHSMKGKMVTVRTTYANTVEEKTFKCLNVHVCITAASFFDPNVVSSINKHSVMSAMQTGIFKRAMRQFLKMDDGTLVHESEF